jgi:hypothetical protein
MDQLVSGNHLLIDISFLIVALMRHLLSEGGANFYLSLVAGGILAAIICFIIRLVVINVNRDYNSGFGFVVGCFLASCTTLFIVVVVVSLQYVDPVVRVAIKGWESTLQSDHAWSNATFRDAYEAVYALKDSNGKPLENFTNTPHPDKGGMIIPMSSDESKIKAIAVYLNRSVEHFDKNMPFLSWILWANSGMAKENIYQDMKRVFTTNPTYQMSDAISIAGKEIAKILSGQTKRIIWFGRIIALTVFAFIQMVIIGLLVLSAHRDIRENI